MIKDIFKANRTGLKFVFKKYWYFIILQLSFSVVAGFSAYVTSWYSKAFIDKIVIDKNISAAMMVIVAFVSYSFVRNILQSLTAMFAKKVYSKTKIVSNASFIEDTKSLNLAFFDIPENRSSFFRAEFYVTNGTEQLISYLFYFFSNIIACVSILYLLSSFEIWVVVFLSVLVIYKIVIDSIISKRDFKFKKNRVTLDRKVGYFNNIFKSPYSLMDLNVNSSYDLFKNHYEENSQEQINKQYKHDKINLVLTITTYITFIVQNVVLYWYAGNALLNSTITISEFTMFFTATTHFNALLINIKNSILPFYNIALESKNYRDFLNIKKNNTFTVRNAPGSIEIKEIQKIEFKNVSFNYPRKKRPILKNVSFVIEKGETVSFVGINGAGKTTIIKLLMKFYPPTEGEILINDIPLNEINMDSYWRLCNCVFQNFSIYALSAIENISMKKDEESDSETIIEYLKQENLYEKLINEKNGIKTILSRDFEDDGTDLSGGEKQKIALLRSKYKNGNMYIFDEPSSALDALSENDFYKYIVQCSTNEDNIVLFVSHKLSFCKIANKVVFLDNCEIADIGNHDYLMEHCEKYKIMYNNQKEKYGYID